MSSALDKLIHGEAPDEAALADFIENIDDGARSMLYEASANQRDAVFGRRVYLRGLIEFTNYCRCNCLYCGIRRDNIRIGRYRLSEEQILACCRVGFDLGYRTFVLQGGEDPYFSDDRLEEIITRIRGDYPAAAITLSLGERSKESYKRLREAGADRYLLRHETADAEHFSRLHPEGQSLDTRLHALWDLKEAGFQTGAGFMVGSPYQTPGTLAKDLLFLRYLQPHMIGIGPFIPHKSTPLGRFPQGSVQRTLDMLAAARLLVPRAMMPATTALGTVSDDGRLAGLKVGANVVMPNLSPFDVRELYSIYDGKKSGGGEAAESLDAIQRELIGAGYVPDMARGDWT